MALSYKKKLGMITTSPMHNGGHLRVCAVKRSSRHMGQISGLNNQTAQTLKPL